MVGGDDDGASVRSLDIGPLRAASLATQAYDRLRRAITEGALAEHSPLVISKLVKLFGTSHTPIREALARLHADGLVSFVDNVGYRVAGPPRESDLLHWMEARLPLEVACARLAAERICAEDVERLREINARIRDEAPGSDFEGVRHFSDLNAQFHRVIVSASRNPFLQRAHDQIWLGAHFSRVRFRRAADHRQIVAEHDTIASALARSDVRAAAVAMERHIVDSLGRDRPQAPPEPAAAATSGGGERVREGRR